MPPEILEVFKSGGAWAVALMALYILFTVVTKTGPEAADKMQVNFITALEKTTEAYAELTKHQLTLGQAADQLLNQQVLALTQKLDLLLKTLADNGACKYPGEGK